MDFRLLGPLEVGDGQDGSLPIGGAKQRALLAKICSQVKALVSPHCSQSGLRLIGQRLGPGDRDKPIELTNFDEHRSCELLAGRYTGGPRARRPTSICLAETLAGIRKMVAPATADPRVRDPMPLLPFRLVVRG